MKYAIVVDGIEREYTRSLEEALRLKQHYSGFFEVIELGSNVVRYRDGLHVNKRDNKRDNKRE